MELQKPSRKNSQEPQKDSRWGFRGMTVRNWLELLVVPLVLLGIGLLFQIQQSEVEERRLEAEQHIEEQRAQDEALQTYLEQMGQMLLDEDRPLLQSKVGDEVQLLARARTVTILRRLDSARNRDILQFLREAQLVPSNKYHIQEHIVRLDNSNLSNADLSDANLSEADLSYDTLSSANLQGANLSDANLTGANLSNAKVSSEQLAETKSLEGATMPNGQKYEDWLKDKEGHG